MKMEEGNVRRKKYNGHYTKHWVKIPKAIWTSPILKRRFTCWTSFNNASLMKDDVKYEVFNRTPRL
jgi:hypothetical protein